jgi:hypothetical protein
MFARIISWITGGFLDRALSSVDKYVEAQTDREKIKADVVSEYYRNRASWMSAGGFWVLLLFAIPTAIHYASVVFYSIFWCADCAYPVSWTIAALPGAMNEWAGWVVIACLGGAGAFAWKR